MTLPPTYCITLRQTPERWAVTQRVLDARGVRAEPFYGVHGRTWGIGTREWFGDQRDAGDWRVPPGHVGLNLSHWMLWTHLMMTGVEEALILEDDAVPCDGFEGAYRACREELPGDWGLWMLGTVNSQPGPMVSAHLCRMDSAFGTHAYMVRRATLPTLLDRMQSCRDHVDVQLARALHGVAWYVAWPGLVSQRTADGQWQGCCHQDYIPPSTAKRDEAVWTSMALQGWCPEEKAAVIYDGVTALAAKFAEPLVGVEIGVWGGRSLLPAALAMRDAGRGFICGIDPYSKEAAIEGLGTEGDEGRHRSAWENGAHGEYEAARKGCEAAIEANRLGAHCGLLVSMPEAVVTGFDRLHYLHIDDSHSVVTSCRNVSTWMPKILPGGLLVLDDAAWKTVQPARELVRAAMRIREDLSDQSAGRRWEVYER